MPTSRKPTSIGIPAPVPPAPTSPLRHKPPTLEMETPPTIDQGLVEHTAIDDEAGPDKPYVPPTLPDEPRWEERSTIAEKSSSKRGMSPVAASLRPSARALTPRPPEEVPLATPTPREDDSARVLADFDDSRVGGPTGIDSVVASMPTAIQPNEADGTAPLGALGEGRLVVIGGADRGREFVLTAHETSLGRGADNDIILTDIAVSRRHIVLFTDGARFGVRDLSSGNGTLVNGIRIVGDVFVRDGDQLELGNTLIRFEQASAFSTVGAPPPPQPAAGVVVGGGLLPLGSFIPLPGIPPERPGAPQTAAFVSRGSSASFPLQPQVFAPSGGEVPAPEPALAPEASLEDFVPVSPATGPHEPSAGAMDLFRSQRKIVFTLAGGVAAFALLLWIVVSLASRSDEKDTVVSTEATTSPALNALLADVDTVAPGAPAPVPEAPAPAAAAATPPAPARAPAPPPAEEEPPAAVAAEPPAPPTPPARPPAGKPARPRPAPRPVKGRPAPRPNVALVAERSAIAAYKSRDFARAADILTAAAAKESGAAADRLEALARDFTQVGVHLAKGDAAAGSNPAAAMVAYKQAYALDARSGKGVHAAYLKAALGKVIPKAASSLMSAGKFEQARNACDDARDFGSGADPAVNRVRNLLEGKARDLYNQGNALAKSKPDEAKSLWRRVLKMVPAESPWYGKSYAALNKVTKSSAQDEDE